MLDLVRNKIASGDLQGAIQILIDNACEDATLIAGRYADLVRNNSLGLLGTGDYDRARNRITYAVLDAAMRHARSSKNVISNTTIIGNGNIHIGDSSGGYDRHNSQYPDFGRSTQLEPTFEGPTFHANSTPYSALLDFVNGPHNILTPQYIRGISLMESVVQALSYVSDLEEYQDKAEKLVKRARKEDMSIAEWKEFAEELAEIVLELQKPTVDVRTRAIADGSTFTDMDAYINELKALKTITAAKATQLRSIYSGATSKLVGTIKLRNELKKY